MKKSILSLALVSLFTSSAALASYEAGDFVVRAGATMVSPDDGKSGVDLNGADSGLTVSVDDNTQLGLNFVYFFDSNWAVEVLAATPFTHDVKLQAGDTETTLGEVTHLPPTVSAVYYFDTGSKFQPYVGAGLNYTIFFDEEFSSTYKEAGFKDLELDGSLGFAVQVGADYQLNDNWHVNASVRYIDIATEAKFKVADIANGSADIDVDPMVYSVMLGYKF
ncbi:OmpW/AlkL family protein [Thalassomonas sp. M1454]|uniref:OmpW/AlkL family protein n=1 Tax=Thalassomonas sp. M1454 TaxID=2594477 RepID=UPI00117DAFEF|nr:OmpW family outer membrane protein [Thalassomonas sp. M1454]TRX58169.1 outer membrane beta-barrel protein [Thalassomonas sp. M1454]